MQNIILGFKTSSTIETGREKKRGREGGRERKSDQNVPNEN